MTTAKICAVVKADAYGHGIEVLRALTAADEFAVASVGEACEIYEQTDKPVNVLSSPDKTVACGYRERIFPAVSTVDDLRFVSAAGGAVAVNIKVNSGMNRYGASPTDLETMLKEAERLHLRVKSVFSHVYDLSAAERQFAIFDACTKPFSDYIPQRHILSSHFVRLPSYMHLDMVRPGIVLYGYGHECVKSVVTAACGIVQIRETTATDNIGYGHCRSGRRRTVAVLGVGYADGYRRRRDNEPRYVVINHRLCPVVGQVCMDATMVDVSGLDVAVGDQAQILGPLYGPDALAASYGSINYEVLTGLGKRVKRIYRMEHA